MSDRQRRRWRVRKLWLKRLKETAQRMPSAMLFDYGWYIGVSGFMKNGNCNAIRFCAPIARKRTAADIEAFIRKTAQRVGLQLEE